MQLWTHHPSGFSVDDPDLVIDFRKGEYAKEDTQDNKGFRYCNVLPKLHTRVGTTQFLWCCTKRGEYPRAMEDDDSVEWELNVLLTQVLTFYRVSVWEDIVWNRNDNWDRLLIPVGATEPAGSQLNDLGALVRVPLDPNRAKCHGQLPLSVTGAD